MKNSSPLHTEQVWELLSDKLRTFFRKRVSNQDQAEDLLQETFLRIHLNLEKLGEQDRLAPWTFQIARHLLTDYYRKEARSNRTEHRPEDSEGLEGNLNELVAGWLPAMIEKLPESYRTAVRLYELEGVPQKQIAEELNLSLSGVKSRVQRGRKKLLEQLLDCCSFERDRLGNILDFQRKRTLCSEDRTC